MRRVLLVPFVIVLMGALPPGRQLSQPVVAGTRETVESDFNGDGFSDLAIGAPGYSHVRFQAGEVNVLYGGPSGLSSQEDQLWRPDSPGLNWGNADTSTVQFGVETASGDFDADGFADLAIGAPGAEQVHVLYGSADGLTTTRDQRWEPRSPGLDGYYSYRLGEVLETGDFNGDGYAELAIGVPDLCCENYVGHLRILYGSASGLTAEGNQLWSELSPGLKGPLPPNDNDVGWASDLVAGDFGKGPEDDLAIPEPLNRGGFVHVLYGTSEGLSVRDDQLWSQDSWGVPGDSDDGRFGGSLAAGDFGGEKPGLEDLAISAQAGYYDTSGGAVIILYARSKGLAGTQSEIFTQDTVGVEDEAEPGDGFGRTLAAGDFDSQGADDLAIGAPFEDREGREDIGAVNVLYSSSCASFGIALCAIGGRFLSLDVPGISGRGGRYDRFASALVAGNFGLGHSNDLAIGIPGRDVGESERAGAVAVIYGSSIDGLTSENSQVWTQDSPRVRGQSKQDDHFGASES